MAARGDTERPATAVVSLAADVRLLQVETYEAGIRQKKKERKTPVVRFNALLYPSVHP